MGLKIVLTLIGILTSCLCIGCVSQSPLDVPKSAPTMQELFEGQVKPGRSMTPSLLLVRAGNSGAEADKTTPLLPNPQFQMYVFPRISSRDQVRIPGYWISFDLYERNEPALDHESLVLDKPDDRPE